MDSGTFTHDGVVFQYDVCGDGNKHVVLQHGLSDYAPCWGDMFTDLRKAGFRVAMMDMRGHGRSGKPDNGYDLQTITEDMMAFIDHLDLDRPVVIGHSVGGSMTVHAAAEYPEKIRAAILIDPVFDESLNENMSSIIEQRNIQSLKIKKMSHHEVKNFAKKKHPEWEQKYIDLYAMSKILASENINQILSSINDFWKDDLQKLKNPTMLITAEKKKGAIVSQETSAWIHESYPEINILHVPDVGHNSHRENYPLVYKKICNFLKTQF